MSHCRKNSEKDKVIGKNVNLFREKHTPHTESGPSQRASVSQNVVWLAFMGWVIS